MWNKDDGIRNEPVREPRPVQPLSPALPVEERRIVAWVGKSVVFTGTLVSSEDMTIDGRVEGTIEVRDHGLTVGPNADIHADVAAKVVTIHGSVVGTVRATVKVDIRNTGRVDGDVIAPRIVVVEGAIVRGRIDTIDEPSEAMKARAQLAIA